MFSHSSALPEVLEKFRKTRKFFYYFQLEIREKAKEKIAAAAEVVDWALFNFVSRETLRHTSGECVELSACKEGV